MPVLVRFKKMIVVLGLCAGLISVGGCSSHHDDNSMDGPQTEAEYNTEAASLTWPPGRPAPSPSHHLRTDLAYEPGNGVSDADQQWLCAWEVHYLGDPATRASDSLAQLVKFKGMHGYTKSYAVETKEAFDKMLSSLELGDAGPLQRDVTANCMVE
ncbi:Putative uncharacterized protein [Propionibacterium freudenreichii]|nr:hypothetical protein [Propionibacterium freudenreichii]MCT2984527.1 hypothetical protein [Propionibacterium freudenreichii]MCT2987658.1 hypothetical protein [Propionibacterium freudenreichii]MCT3000856.1 hypothetical protein [Propionibacterium freudenreichii]CEH03186.1 Putative uncharacterized protein [Propionibacterium freudenreichii]